MRHKCYLTLHLPVPWDYNNKQYSTQYKDGITSNTYHQQFKQLTGIDSLNDLDFIIQNAGISQRSYVKDTKFQVYRDLMELDFFSVVAFTQALLPHLTEQKKGHFVRAVRSRI